MPYKSGSLKGQLTTAEIRKLVRAHNAVIKKNLIIKIPPGSDRDKIIKIINDKGFDIKHGQKRIEPLDNVSAYDYISLDMVEKILKKPEKTEEQKQQEKAKKEAKVKKQKQKEGELIKKGAVIGKLVAKKQMAKQQKKVVSKSDTKKQKN